MSPRNYSWGAAMLVFVIPLRLNGLGLEDSMFRPCAQLCTWLQSRFSWHRRAVSELQWNFIGQTVAYARFSYCSPCACRPSILF